MSAPRTRPTAQNPSDTSSHERDEQSLRELERQKASASRRDRDREPHGSRRDRDRSTKQRASSQRPSTLKNWQRVLLAVLFFCGPIGTLVSFWLLPKEADGADALGQFRHPPGVVDGGAGGSVGGTRVRMVHLSLAGTDRRARFVLDENTPWDAFISGCRERLKVERILRVTDSSGEAILAVEDLVHEDHIVLHATGQHGGAQAVPTPGPAEDRPPSPPSPPALSAFGAMVGKSRSLQSVAHGDDGGAAMQLEAATNHTPPGGSSDDHDGLLDAAVAEHGAHASVAARGGAAAAAQRRRQQQQQQQPAAQQLDLQGRARELQGLQGLRTAAAQEASMPDLLQQLDTLKPEARERDRDRDRQERDAAARSRESAAAAEASKGIPAPGSEAAAGGGGGGGLDPAALEEEADPLMGLDHNRAGRECGKRDPQHRVAMLIPWVNELPPWLSYFVASARRSAYLIDWLVFHEGLLPPTRLPDNVKFIDMGAGGLSQLFGLKMGEELGLPVKNASLLIRSMRFMLEKWPRLVAEYKPAFGSIFEQYISDYSHWGYCDLDMVLGNLPLFIEQSELAKNDIVTYSFGDMDALYLRGQWTLHANRHDVSTVWKGCPHLGEDLQKELLMKVAWVRRMESRGIKNYPKRFQSAEGCYSHRAASQPGIRIKMAHKQFVGLTVPSDDQIYAVNGAVWQCPKAAAVSVAELEGHSQQPCSADLPGVQEALGEMLPLQVSADGGCGKWMPVEYRMCAANLPEPPERERDLVSFNIYLRDGKFYAQRFRSTLPVLDNGCRQGAFFHMQEWKKIWGYGTHGVDPLELVYTERKPPTFTVTTEGIELLG